MNGTSNKVFLLESWITDDRGCDIKIIEHGLQRQRQPLAKSESVMVPCD